MYTADEVCACQARCAEGVALLGRSAADAAYDVALAGAEGGVIEALASLQACAYLCAFTYMLASLQAEA